MAHGEHHPSEQRTDQETRDGDDEQHLEEGEAHLIAGPRDAEFASMGRCKTEELVHRFLTTICAWRDFPRHSPRIVTRWVPSSAAQLLS